MAVFAEMRISARRKAHSLFCGGFSVATDDLSVFIFLRFVCFGSKMSVIANLMHLYDNRDFLLCSFSGKNLEEPEKRSNFAASKREI